MNQFNDNQPNSSDLAPAQQAEENKTQLNIRDILYKCLDNWYWFLICMVLTATLAQYYLLSTNNVYTRTAALLVKDSKSAINEAAEFADLSVFNNNTNIENELVILRSPALMDDVVERLGLNNTFTSKEGLRNVELYKNAPVDIKPIDSIVAPSYSFDVTIVAPDKITLSEFKAGVNEFDKTITANLGETVQTPIGNFKIEATDFIDNYIGKSVKFAHRPADDVALSYAGRLMATKDKGQGSIINLAITDPSIQKADDILDTLIQVYNERWIQDRNQISLSTSRFIDERLNIIESELGNVESDISSFKSANLLPDIEAVSSIYLNQSETNRQAVVELSNQKALAQYIRKELSANNSISKPLPQSTALADAQVAGMINDFNEGVIERNRLVEASSVENPVVKDLSASLQTMRSNIIASVDGYISTLNAQIKSYENQSRITAGKLAANPNQAKYLLSVERQQKVKESLYLYLLQKREENELSQAFTAYNTRVVTPPGGSKLPTSPNRTSILLISILIGLLIPAGIITAREALNTRVRGRKDLEKMNVPFIGEVPQAPGSKGKKAKVSDRDESPYVVKRGGTDILNEAIRVVRSNMEFMMPQARDSQKGIVVAVTSINPGSGKSFISANIATAFSLKGKRCIILDLDLRRATLSARHGKSVAGLSNILSGRQDDWQSLILKGEDGRPDFFPAGPIPPNPSELLYSQHLTDLIAELRNDYDLIFIDCPPVEVVADTYIINRFADLTLFIVRAGLLERDMIPEIERIYASGKLKNVGMILNGTTSYKGGKRYGYSYSYGYGYSYKYKDK